MNSFNVRLMAKTEPKLNRPILIVGLPGIGNVGKIAADFMVDKLKAQEIYEIYSHYFPHSVFITESNLVELPTVSLALKKGKPDLLFLIGDVQPSEEKPSYEFAELILDIVQKLGCSKIITLGGIGLPQVPKEPKVYCTGTERAAIEDFCKDTKVDSKLYGIVGPILGVSGLLLGLAKRRNIPAISLLAETYGHPMYLGMKGSREIITVLNQKLGLKLNIKDLDKEISTTEEELIKRQQGMAVKKQLKKGSKDVSYIG